MTIRLVNQLIRKIQVNKLTKSPADTPIMAVLAGDFIFNYKFAYFTLTGACSISALSLYRGHVIR